MRRHGEFGRHVAARRVKEGGPSLDFFDTLGMNYGFFDCDCSFRHFLSVGSCKSVNVVRYEKVVFGSLN